MKGRGFKEPLNQHSVNKTVINSQNMELGLSRHTHNLEDNMCKPQQMEKYGWKKRTRKGSGKPKGERWRWWWWWIRMWHFKWEPIWSVRCIILIGNLTVWKARSHRFHPESSGSSRLIFEVKNKQRRWCYFSKFKIGLVHYYFIWPFCLWKKAIRGVLCSAILTPFAFSWDLKDIV